MFTEHDFNMAIETSNYQLMQSIVNATGEQQRAIWISRRILAPIYTHCSTDQNSICMADIIAGDIIGSTI